MTDHTVFAHLTAQDGDPAVGVTVTFLVNDLAANTGCLPVDCVTSGDGNVNFTYTRNTPGVDLIRACIGGDDAPLIICSNSVTKIWTPSPAVAAESRPS